MESWGYLSGLLRAEKVHTLNNNDFMSYTETVNAESLLKLLEDTNYGALFQERSMRDFSVIFDEYYLSRFQEIKALSPCPIMINVHELKVDLNNLKLCYKAKISQKNINWEQLSEEGTISPERMFTIVEQELWNELPNTVYKAILLLQESSEMRRVDFLLDKAYYTHRLELLIKAAQYEPDYYKGLVDLYKKEIDCENIKNILRAKKMNLEKDQIAEIIIHGGYITASFFIDYANLSSEDIIEIVKDSSYGTALALGINHWGTTYSGTLLEKQIDEYLLEQSINFTFNNEGPMVIEETLRALQIEIKNLKLIIIGKLNNMSVEEIQERVRNVRV